MKQIVTYFAALLLTSSSAFGQSELVVNCYNSNSVYNLYSIDDQVIEYATCSFQPAFYVAVIDPSNCTAWGTNYNGANPTHAFGNMNEGNCRSRVEYYFVFDAADSLQLAGMLNMLQTIPAGHSLIVYTPVSYDYSAVHAVNPDLIQELENRWDPSVIQGNDIMVLYGEEGNTASFVEETTQNAGQISFSTTICNSLSINTEVIEPKLVLKQNGTTFFLNPDLKIEDLQILDAAGKQVSFVKTENSIQLQAGISAGIYIFQGTASGKNYRRKQMISF